MDGTWDITLDGERIGTCRTRDEGLYRIFHCSCTFPRDGIYRILLRSGDTCIRLGIPVPGQGGYVLHTKVPIRNLPKKEFHLVAYPKESTPEDRFVPLRPGEPFPYLRQLPGCRLAYQGDELGVILPDNN